MARKTDVVIGAIGGGLMTAGAMLYYTGDTEAFFNQLQANPTQALSDNPHLQLMAGLLIAGLVCILYALKTPSPEKTSTVDNNEVEMAQLNQQSAAHATPSPSRK